MNALKRHGNNCRDLIDKMAETMKYAQKRMGLDMLSWGYHLSPMTLCTRTSQSNKELTEPGRNSLTISRVHTRRIQTFNFPSTPSTPSNSIPSHQQRLAGFLQKSNSFWAMPTEALLLRSPLISVRSFANARLQITALLGSGARWPQESS